MGKKDEEIEMLKKLGMADAKQITKDQDTIKALTGELLKANKSRMELLNDKTLMVVSTPVSGTPEEIDKQLDNCMELTIKRLESLNKQGMKKNYAVFAIPNTMTIQVMG